MSQIVIFLDESANRPDVLMALHRATKYPLSRLKQAIENGQAVLELELFDHDYDDHAVVVRSFVDCLEDSRLGHRIYELPEGESTVDERHQISIDILRNIFNEADAEMRRQLGE